MGQVVYTGSISGNHNLNANGSDGVTVYLSRSGAFPASYTVTSATLYLSKFYCYSRSYGIDLYLNGERVNNSEMCGSEVTQKESNGSTSWYSISGTWNLSTGADYEDVSAADIVSRAHSASSTGVMNLRDGCQVKITVEYSEGSSGGGGNPGGGDNTGGGGNDSTLEHGDIVNLRLSANESTGEPVMLTWDLMRDLSEIQYIIVYCSVCDGAPPWNGGTNYLYVQESARVDSDDVTAPISYALSVSPPTKVGQLYRYQVRTGVQGEWTSYSEYSETLRLVRPPITPYTDEPIIAGETRVKATHMLELQANINVIRKGAGLSEHAFNDIVAGRTGLSGWSGHVAELRNAIDEMDFEHEPWIAFDVNAPRADVIEQLRRVVAALW